MYGVHGVKGWRVAGAGWESQPAHNVPSSVTVEAETSMSRQEGPVGKKEIIELRASPQRVPIDTKTSEKSSYPLCCRLPGAGGAAPPGKGQEDQNGY